MSGRPVAPAGWPDAVRPAGAPEWERSAVAWMLDLCPAEYRGYEVLRRHPVVLARLAVAHAGAALDACRGALGTLRADLRDVAAPPVVDAAVEACEREVARLSAAAAATRLVEEALRGRRFVERL